MATCPGCGVDSESCDPHLVEVRKAKAVEEIAQRLGQVTEFLDWYQGHLVQVDIIDKSR